MRQRTSPSPTARQHPFRLQQLVLAVAFCALPTLGFAAPLAGDIISNMAIGEYTEEGSTVVQTSRSNLVQTTIIPVAGFTLQANRSQNAVVGQTVRFNHILTNSGNIADNYTLTAVNATSGDNFDYSNLKIYVDANQDGLPDGGAINSYALAAGQSVGIIVEGVIPNSGVSSGNSGLINFTATATNNSTATNTDTATISNQAVLLVRKSFVTDTGGNVTAVRIDYENKASIATGQVDLSDVLNSGLSYKAGSESWNGQALNLASGNNDPSGINYYLDTDGKTVRASLTSIAANSSGYIQFGVNLLQTAAGKIPNTVNFSYNNGSTTLSDTSNTVVWQINPIYGVVLNADAASNTNSGSSDQVVAPNIVDGAEVVFNNYVWNTGNSDDRYNLTISSDTFPMPHQVEFYRADGVTPLLDSNGDGIPDTGMIAAGQKLAIVVKVRMPTTALGNAGTSYTVKPLARSLGDSSKTDTVTDTVSVANTDISVDLVNQPETSNNGLGNANIANSGAAWKTLTGNSNGQIVFPLKVTHTGTATRYSFAADGDGDFSKLELPTGVATVRYFENTAAGNDCSSMGVEIGQTRLLNNGETQTYCAVVQLKEVTVSVSNVPIYFRVASATYADSNTNGFDTIKNALTINSLNASGTVSLDPDLRGQVAPGGTVVYSHMLTNHTNTALTGTFALGTVNDHPDFTVTYYLDSNNNGQLDSADQLISGNLTLSGAMLPANSSIGIFAKVQAPNNSVSGVTDTITLQLKDSNGNILDTATDVTRVTKTQLRLYKLQAKDDNCDGIADGSYTTNALPIGRNSDGSSQCVLYRLTVKNEGASAVGKFTFYDAVPVAMVLENAPSCVSCSSGSISAPSKGTSGNVSGQLPTVNSGTSYDFEFGVRYVGQ